jgi:hypothetical protein
MKLSVFLILLFSAVGKLPAQQPFFPVLSPKDHLWTYISAEGKATITVKAAYSDLRVFSEGLAGAKDAATGLWGFIDQRGRWRIKPAFESVKDFRDGYALVGKTCQTDCYTGSEGIRSSEIRYVIDKKGKVVLTDHSQHEHPEMRYFFEENLGKGLVRITFGHGYADMKNLINLEGKLLCATYSVLGSGDIEYEPALDAFRCQNRYYNAAGELVLDPGPFRSLGFYSEGYVWAMQEDAADNSDEFIYWNVLLDKEGREVLRLNEDEFSAPGKVINGRFTYTDMNLERMSYILAENRSIPYTQPEVADSEGEAVEPPVTVDERYTIGPKQANGTRYLFLGEEELAGFIASDGSVFFMRASE